MTIDEAIALSVNHRPRSRFGRFLSYSGEEPAITQPIEYTDFDLPEIDLWVGPVDERHFVLMLPNEY